MTVRVETRPLFTIYICTACDRIKRVPVGEDPPAQCNFSSELTPERPACRGRLRLATQSDRVREFRRWERKKN